MPRSNRHLRSQHSQPTPLGIEGAHKTSTLDDFLRENERRKKQGSDIEPILPFRFGVSREARRPSSSPATVAIHTLHQILGNLAKQHGVAYNALPSSTSIIRVDSSGHNFFLPKSLRGLSEQNLAEQLKRVCMSHPPTGTIQKIGFMNGGTTCIGMTLRSADIVADRQAAQELLTGIPTAPDIVTIGLGKLSAPLNRADFRDFPIPPIDELLPNDVDRLIYFGSPYVHKLGAIATTR
jgi:hypothetical protein